MGGSGIWAILLLILGLGSLAAEVFLPSGGLLALLTVCLLVSSTVCAAMQWWTTMPLLVLLHIGFILLLVPGTLALAFMILPRTRAGRRILLEPPPDDRVSPARQRELMLSQYIGQSCVAATPLSPGGTVLVQKHRIDATTEGFLIAAGTSLVITAVKDGILVVREKPAHVASQDVFASSVVDPVTLTAASTATGSLASPTDANSESVSAPPPAPAGPAPVSGRPMPVTPMPVTPMPVTPMPVTVEGPPPIVAPSGPPPVVEEVRRPQMAPTIPSRNERPGSDPKPPTSDLDFDLPSDL